MEYYLMVRCRRCEHVFRDEQTLDYPSGKQFCPDCEVDKDGFDYIGFYGEVPDKDIFPILTQCDDWEQIKANFAVETLCYFENEIHDYEYNQGAYSEANFEDCTYIIYWFEGSVDTKDLIEYYSTL